MGRRLASSELGRTPGGEPGLKIRATLFGVEDPCCVWRSGARTACASVWLFWSESRARSAPDSLESGQIEKAELNKKLYVGNLSFSTTEAELRELFEEHGAIESVNVITDRETGRSRGFAFVELEDAGSAEKAMRALDGREVGGRTLRVNEANERGGGRNR